MTALATRIRDLATYYAPYSWFLVVWAAPLLTLCGGGFVFNRAVRNHQSGTVAATSAESPPRLARRSSI
ncbi:MAG TPA: hypothetical protein VII52_13385, partial [Gemmatimonadaceae bacterium]